MDEESVACGYSFALELASLLYPELDHQRIFEQAELVAIGHLSIHNSPEEELAEFERKNGPVSEAQAADFLSMFRNRREIDEKNREVAIHVVRLLTRDYRPPPPLV